MIAALGLAWLARIGSGRDRLVALLVGHCLGRAAIAAPGRRRAPPGLRPFPARPAFTPSVRRLLWLALPAAVTGGITQVNLLVGQNIASGQEGAIAVINYADRLFQLPLGIITNAIARGAARRTGADPAGGQSGRCPAPAEPQPRVRPRPCPAGHGRLSHPARSPAGAGLRTRRVRPRNDAAVGRRPGRLCGRTARLHADRHLPARILTPART